MSPNNNNPNNNNQFNQDELEAPAWMNADFFTNVLQSSEKDDTIRVTNLKLSPGSMKGDHYASAMFRANVDYETTETRREGSQQRHHKLSMVIKTLPDENLPVVERKQKILHEVPVFETEIEMYSKVLPRFETILREAGEEVVLGARCLYHSLSPRKVIILEDIVPLGYRVLRSRQANLEEVKLAYSKLAKFHAVSYKLLKEDPTVFDKFHFNIIHLAKGHMTEFFGGGIDHFIEALSTQPELLKYKTYFDSLRLILLDRSFASFNEFRIQPKEESFYVLCHGDFHSLNMMFRRIADDQSDDVLLLDYQLSHVGPMVVDFIYSIYTLMDRDLRQQHLDELIYYYFSTFTTTLKRLDPTVRVPRLLDFRRMLTDHKDFEILIMIVLLPFWYDLSKDGFEIDKALNCPEYRRKMYQNEMFLKEVKEILANYLHRGYLDN